MADAVVEKQHGKSGGVGFLARNKRKQHPCAPREKQRLKLQSPGCCQRSSFSWLGAHVLGSRQREMSREMGAAAETVLEVPGLCSQGNSGHPCNQPPLSSLCSSLSWWSRTPRSLLGVYGSWVTSGWWDQFARFIPIWRERCLVCIFLQTRTITCRFSTTRLHSQTSVSS